METLSYSIGMAGTVAFAVTAVLALAPLRVDLFGATVLGIVTAIGGGTMRDVILDEPVFWAYDLNYLWVAMLALRRNAPSFPGVPICQCRCLHLADLFDSRRSHSLGFVSSPMVAQPTKRMNLIRESGQDAKATQ